MAYQAIFHEYYNNSTRPKLITESVSWCRFRISLHAACLRLPEHLPQTCLRVSTIAFHCSYPSDMQKIGSLARKPVFWKGFDACPGLKTWKRPRAKGETGRPWETMRQKSVASGNALESKEMWGPHISQLCPNYVPTMSQPLYPNYVPTMKTQRFLSFQLRKEKHIILSFLINRTRNLCVFIVGT